MQYPFKTNNVWLQIELEETQNSWLYQTGQIETTWKKQEYQ